MLETLERHPLTCGPTSVERLVRMAEALGGHDGMCAEHEDGNPRLARGGKTLRAPEFIVPTLIRSTADTLVSIGGVRYRQAQAEMPSPAGELCAARTDKAGEGRASARPGATRSPPPRGGIGWGEA